MKKIYITPAILTMTIGMMNLIADSLRVHSDAGASEITDENEILVKSYDFAWENEW